MQNLLISQHLLVLALILGVVSAPLLAAVYRKVCGRVKFNSEQNSRLCFDVATIIPIGSLLWNLSVYHLANVPSPSIILKFEKAVAAAGEATVALATVIIFGRLCGSMWKDLNS